MDMEPRYVWYIVYQTNDDVVCDVVPENLSVMSTCESEMSSNDQVFSMEVLKTNNVITQIVGDNIYFNISSPSVIGLSHPSSTTFARFTRVNLMAFDKANILRGAELKIVPFATGKHIEIKKQDLSSRMNE